MSARNKVVVNTSIICKNINFSPKMLWFLVIGFWQIHVYMPFQFIMPIEVEVIFMLKLNETIYYIPSWPENSAKAAIAITI